MEKAMYPSKVIRITQKHGVGTHKNNYAVDEAGKDGGIGDLIAPFTGNIMKIYKADANEVWLQSKNKVMYADGTKDYMTIMFAHDNDVSDLWVGKEIKAGTVFYQEGVKGEAYGNHVHFEVGKGKFTGTGWHQDGNAWDINNGKRVDECLWIDDTYTIKDTAGYNFRNVKETEVKKLGTSVERNELVEQVRVFEETIVLRARKTPNGDVLGYVNPGIYNILEKASAGDYEWFRVENDLWFAFSEEWMELLEVKSPDKSGQNEEKPDSAEELQTTAEQLQKELDAAYAEIASLKEQLANAPKLIFESTKLDYYAIELDENQKLYLG